MKKIISLLLSAVMAVSLIAVAPITAGAEETEETHKIYFDATGWEEYDYEYIFAHIWSIDETGEWLSWEDEAEKCTLEDDGRWSYDLSKTGNEISPEDGRIYYVIFSTDTLRQTYKMVMSGNCIGDTAYLTGELYKTAEDMITYDAKWKNNPDCGSLKSITYSGEVAGTGLPEGVTDATLLAEYLIENCDDWLELTKVASALLEELNVTEEDVWMEAYLILDEKISEGILTEEDADDIFVKVISSLENDADKFRLYKEADDYDIYYYDDNDVLDITETQRLENYLIVNSYVNSLYALEGIYYIGYADKMYSIPDACEKGIADEDELISILSEAPDILICLIGDANGDNVVDINDVTQIQWYLAGASYFDFNQEEIADFNGDGSVDINDATYIQMKLAGYENV